jgi:hypothetical protein
MRKGSCSSKVRAFIPRYTNFSLPEEEEGIHRQWIQSNAETDVSPDNADWADAWFSLDALMHRFPCWIHITDSRTCHASATVTSLRSRPGSASENEIHKLMNELSESHEQWRERRVVRKSDNTEIMNEHFRQININRDDTKFISHEFPLKSERFLKYHPVYICDPFFGSRLNNWRAIYLYINLIQEPMWGLHIGSRFMCAADLCRTHAALGNEQSFLGAEKAVGIYLAGLAFGGPEMYTVGTQFHQSTDCIRMNQSGY